MTKPTVSKQDVLMRAMKTRTCQLH